MKGLPFPEKVPVGPAAAVPRSRGARLGEPPRDGPALRDLTWQTPGGLGGNAVLSFDLLNFVYKVLSQKTV